MARSRAPQVSENKAWGSHWQPCLTNLGAFFALLTCCLNAPAHIPVIKACKMLWAGVPLPCWLLLAHAQGSAHFNYAYKRLEVKPPHLSRKIGASRDAGMTRMIAPQFRHNSPVFRA